MKLTRRGLPIDYGAVLAVVDARELLEPGLMLRRQLPFDEAPLPVAPRPSRQIHPRPASQPDHVLHRNQRRIGHRHEERANEHPVDFDLGIAKREAEVLRYELVLTPQIVLAPRTVADTRSPPAD